MGTHDGILEFMQCLLGISTVGVVAPPMSAVEIQGVDQLLGECVERLRLELLVHTVETHTLETFRHDMLDACILKSIEDNPAKAAVPSLCVLHRLPLKGVAVYVAALMVDELPDLAEFLAGHNLGEGWEVDHLAICARVGSVRNECDVLVRIHLGQCTHRLCCVVSVLCHC